MVFIYNYQVTIFLVYAYLHILRLTFHLFTRLYSLSLLVMCIYIYVNGRCSTAIDGESPDGPY
jgi:uncharacterized membrane protein